MSTNSCISPLEKFVNKPQWRYFGMPNQIFKEDFYSKRFQIKLDVDTDFYRSVLYAFCTHRKFIQFEFVYDDKQDGELPTIDVTFDPPQIRDQFFRQAFNDFEQEKNYNVKKNSKRLKEFVNEYFFEFVNDLASVSQKDGFNLFPLVYPPALVQSHYNIMTVSKLLIVGYNRILQNYGEIHPSAAALKNFLFGIAKRPPEELLKIVCNNLGSVCGVPCDKLLFCIKRKIGHQKDDFLREMMYLTANSRGIRSGPKFSNYNPALNSDNARVYGNTMPNYKIIASSDHNIDNRFKKYKKFLKEWKKSNECDPLPKISPTFDANVSKQSNFLSSVIRPTYSKSISQANLSDFTNFTGTRDSNYDYTNGKTDDLKLKPKELFALKASSEKKSNQLPIKDEVEELVENTVKRETLPISQIDSQNFNNFEAGYINKRGKLMIKVKDFAEVSRDFEKNSFPKQKLQDLRIKVETEDLGEQVLQKSDSLNCIKIEFPAQASLDSSNFDHLKVSNDRLNEAASQKNNESLENRGLFTLNLQTMELSEHEPLQNRINTSLTNLEIKNRKRPSHANSIDAHVVVEKENHQIKIELDQDIDEEKSSGIFMPDVENSGIFKGTNEIKEPDVKKQKLTDYFTEAPISNVKPEVLSIKFEPDNQAIAMEHLVCKDAEGENAPNKLQTENFVENAMVSNTSFLGNLVVQDTSIKATKKKYNKSSRKPKNRKILDVEETLLYPVIRSELTKFMNTEPYKAFVTSKKGVGPFGWLDKKFFLTFLYNHCFLCEIKNPILYKILGHCKFLGRTKTKSYEKFVLDLSKNLSAELEIIFPEAREKSLRLDLYQNLRDKFG